VQVDAVYTDFQKAFDKVNHSILLQKMAALGFVSEALRFFESYLSDREQFGGYRGAISRSSPCPAGIPQWSNLGSLLFSIFI